MLFHGNSGLSECTTMLRYITLLTLFSIHLMTFRLHTVNYSPEVGLGTKGGEVSLIQHTQLVRRVGEAVRRLQYLVTS